MANSKQFHTKKSDRIQHMIDHLYAKLPVIEADRAVLVTESYRRTESDPIILRRAKAFSHILANIPIIIRDEELIVGSASIAPRGCQTFPEFSFEWLEAEFDTVEKRSADPFYISEETKAKLREVNPYWKGKTTSDLATSFMAPEAKKSMEHNVFTTGNYFYNGVGHITVAYDKVLKIGFEGIYQEAEAADQKLKVSDPDYAKKHNFEQAVMISCRAVCDYANRYAKLAEEEAEKYKKAASIGNDAGRNLVRAEELLQIAKNCSNVPQFGARSFYEACQSFWFVQMLLQVESSGHSISPGRFDQYMFPYYEADMKDGILTMDYAQELLDCIWVKLNDLNKVRDAVSAEGFAGYSLFQNLVVGGQSSEGVDVTNDLSYLCIEAAMHVMLPQPSLSVRVWNGSPQELLMKAAELTRTGIGLPAYYNDEVIIPSLLNRGLTIEHARDYSIIGCVEPQKPGMTDGWHDAAFFNMCRPLELVFSNGYSKGERISIQTGDVAGMKSFDEFYDAYKAQMEYQIGLLVNSDNSIDAAHAIRCPLPFESCMVESCIERGLSIQEGGAFYNFTGPQGFGIANMADALYVIKKLVFDEHKLTLSELKTALERNFGSSSEQTINQIALAVIQGVEAAGQVVDGKMAAEIIAGIAKEFLDTQKNNNTNPYQELLQWIEDVPKFGNDIDEVDAFARDVAYTYTKPLEKFHNPRGGQFQAGLYPVSANVPLGAQTGATPDGRLAGMPIADGVSPSAGKDIHGPTAAANSVAKLDHYIASNGTLFNQKFHPSALKGQKGLENFVALIRAYFDQKGSHMQFNVVSRDTLKDAQLHPENYKSLVVRVAGYSALFTTLSRSLQDDIIRRTEHLSGI